MSPAARPRSARRRIRREGRRSSKGGGHSGARRARKAWPAHGFWRDPEFARALLQEAVQALLADDVTAVRGLIRDVIKGSIGYAELSHCTGTAEKSLVRMFGASGNPTAANLFAVLTDLQQYSGVSFQVAAARCPMRKKPRRRTGGGLRRGAQLGTVRTLQRHRGCPFRKPHRVGAVHAGTKRVLELGPQFFGA
jgi:DNA-binding phage protein